MKNILIRCYRISGNIFEDIMQNTKNSTLWPKFDFEGGGSGGRFDGIFGIPGHGFLLPPNTFQSSNCNNKMILSSVLNIPNFVGSGG